MKNIIKDGTHWLEVWEGYLKGDEAAFSEIYEEYVDSLFSYGCKITKDREVVKDCIQDIFIDLQRLQPRLHHPEYIEFYLYKSLRNAVLHKIRKESKTQSFSSEEISAFDMQFNIENEIYNEESDHLRIEKLKEILQTLDSQKRELLYLKFSTNLSYVEIAQLVNLNPDTVKKQVYRTLAHLRNKFGKKLLEMFMIISRPEK